MRRSALFAALCLSLQAADVAPLAGDWQGTLSFNGQNHKLAVHVKPSGASWTGTFDALDQGATGIPLGGITITESKLQFQVPAIMGSYDGKFDPKTATIAGTWSQGGVQLPLALARLTAANAPKRPQEPKPPFPYLAENVSYDNPDAKGVRLAGTFTGPKGDGPFPAVLLITGSGAQNRDEEIMGHKPFLVIADYLTRRGIAVLRVDDRGYAESTGNRATATTQDFAGDTAAGVRYLLQRADVDHKHIGLIGHSEGGVIAPMVASKMPEVAFLVLLAGPGVPGATVIEDQVYQANLMAGLPREVAAMNRDFEHKLLAAIMAGDPVDKILAIAGDDPALRNKVKDGLPAMQSPWYRYFLALDPATYLEQVKCPVLALVGSKDSQVSATLNVAPMKAALRKGGNKDFTVQIMPGLNHLFQTANSGAVSEYSQIEETMSPRALETIAAWISKHAGTP